MREWKNDESPKFFWFERFGDNHQLQESSLNELSYIILDDDEMTMHHFKRLC